MRIKATDYDFENQTNEVIVGTEDGESTPTGVHLSCDFPDEGYLTYTIDQSGEMLVAENVQFSNYYVGGVQVVNIEFEGEVYGDIHSFSFTTWEYPEILDQEEMFVDLPLVEIVNGFDLLARYESGDDFEFEYDGFTDIHNSTFMFRFEGTMHSTIGGLDVQVSGLGAVKRPN